MQKYEKQRKHTKEKLQVRRPHIPHNHNHNRAPPNCNPNSNSNRTRLPRHLRTPSRTPGPHTENSGHEHRNSDSALSHEKRASATRNPLLHRTAPKPSLSISKSPIRGTRAEYLRRPPSRPHRPHWDPWRASAGSSNGRSGYPYPATRARRQERPKRPHCRSAG